MSTGYLNPQFITNKKGKKTAVILPIKEYQELLEDLADLAVIAERKDEPTISHKEMIQELINEGLI